ncbi:MAG: hypothetical protein A3J38_09460 [Gammaproteobacteria bacterium RIFCSPHIGHO2_12_FULL_45_9]|nr:MAG: hypothetical protein A3J38_09460 [Gammaproteobacteria bacterium RIFCSPHIGHO2_12_FULL_45_9]
MIAGVDEAGRGPLAGPVVAAAVILDVASPWMADLNDSKKLSSKKRDELFEVILAKAIAVGVGEASVEEIDHINILQATLLAMQRAVRALSVVPVEVWVDGNQAPRWEYQTKTIIGGDASEPAIQAASIIAKVTR